MNRLRTLTSMAMHEMWISFRMILVVAVPVVGGIGAILLPEDFSGVTALGGAGFWFAVAACAAIGIASGVAALTMAHERRRGTVAWMAVRAVPRSVVLMSWFAALGILLVGGIALGSVGPWLAALERAETQPDLLPFAAAVASTATAGLACIAGGLLLGTFLRVLPATLIALALAVPILVASIVLPTGGQVLPTGGIALLAHLDSASRPLGQALQSGGAALAVAAVLLVLASAGLERANL